MKPLHRSPSLPRLALGAVAVSLALAGVQPGHSQTARTPYLRADREMSLDAATTFSNSYGLAFEATGTVFGAASFSPAQNPLTVNNSGTAFLSAMTSLDSGSSGVLSAVSGLSGMVATAGTDQYINRNNSYIYLSGAIGTPNIRPMPIATGINVAGASSSGTMGASQVVTNSGTERLVVSGNLGERVTNVLKDSNVFLGIDAQLAAF